MQKVKVTVQTVSLVNVKPNIQSPLSKLTRQNMSKKIINAVSVVNNYTTDALQERLDVYAKHGYKLVSTEMANNKYDVTSMYLFFVKEIDE